MQKVSIIIPTYNRDKLLKETLHSVLRQTYKNWECIVVDDGSQDRTFLTVENFIRKDNRFKYVKRPNKRLKGANSCRNFGFELSTGDFIQWFDDDDYMFPDLLKTRVEAFNKQIQFVISSGFYANQALEREDKMKLEPNINLFKGLIWWSQQIITNSILFKKVYLVDKELFNEDLSKSQEFEFFSRIFFNIHPEDYLIIEEPLFLYRQHPSSKSTLSSKYINENKRSEAFIYLQNLERCMAIKNGPLVKFIFYRLIELFQESVHFKDIHTTGLITKRLRSILYPITTSGFLKFAMLSKVYALNRWTPPFVLKSLKSVVIDINSNLK